MRSAFQKLQVRPFLACKWHHTVLASLVLATLFLTAGKSLAQESCHIAEDYLSVAAKDDPGLLARIDAKAANTANGKGIFWKIERDQLEPSYLFGTMHVADPRALAMLEPAQDRLDKASVIAIEAVDAIDPQAASRLFFQNPDLTTFLDGRTLADIMPPKDLALVAAALAKQKQAMASFERLKPWVTMAFLGHSECETERMARGQMVLDAKIASAAARNHVPLEGLETGLEQLEAMERLPLDMQVRGLLQTASNLEIGDSVTEAITQLYLQQETGKIWALSTELADDFNHQQAQQDMEMFEKALLTDRNHVMAERAVPLLEKGNAFIAVGAMHLPGNEGLISLLKQKGYSLTVQNLPAD